MREEKCFFYTKSKKNKKKNLEITEKAVSLQRQKGNDSFKSSLKLLFRVDDEMAD